MGNSTGSMLYFFVLIIIIYIVGMLLYTAFQKFKEKRDRKKDEEFKRSDE